MRVGQAGAREFPHVGIDQTAFGVEEQRRRQAAGVGLEHRLRMRVEQHVVEIQARAVEVPVDRAAILTLVDRSEEHTSELQSLMRISYAVFCLKKKNNN